RSHSPPPQAAGGSRGGPATAGGGGTCTPASIRARGGDAAFAPQALPVTRASRLGALGLCARAHSLHARSPMFPTPKPALLPNTYAYESEPMVKATGFREYDARWLFGKEINLMGVQALGMGLGTLIHELGVRPEIVTGHDFRGYSASIKYP